MNDCRKRLDAEDYEGEILKRQNMLYKQHFYERSDYPYNFKSSSKYKTFPKPGKVFCYVTKLT